MMMMHRESSAGQWIIEWWNILTKARADIVLRGCYNGIVWFGKVLRGCYNGIVGFGTVLRGGYNGGMPLSVNSLVPFLQV